MADVKITGLTALTTPAGGDLIPIVDVSDVSMAVTGSTRKITRSDLLALLATFADSGDLADITGVSPFAVYGTHVCYLQAASGEGLAAGVGSDGWYFWNDGEPVAVVFTGRRHSISWICTAAQLPASGSNDDQFQVGDIHAERSSAL